MKKIIVCTVLILLGTFVIPSTANAEPTGQALYGVGQSAYGMNGQGVDIFSDYIDEFDQFGSSNTFVKLDLGAFFSIALDDQGRIWSWGDNESGYTGLNTTIGFTATPTQVGTDSDWTDISVGTNHVIALKDDGTIWSWGTNSYGATGQGTTDDSTNVPTQIGADNDWLEITAGSYFSGAIKDDGTLYTWGFNQDYATMLGTNVGYTSSPSQVGSDSDWEHIYGGNYFAVAIKNGVMVAWGNNDNGRTGTDSMSNPVTTIEQVNTDTDWAQVSPGGFSTLALKTDGTLWSWGNNSDTQLGNGPGDSSSIPIQVGSDNDWAYVSMGLASAYAIKNDGSLWSWGRNDYGQLGLGNTTTTGVPTQVGTETNWEIVAVSFWHSIAVGPFVDNTPVTITTTTIPTAAVPGVTINGSNNVAPGSSITLNGSGFKANDTLNVELHSTPVSLGTVATDASGSFSKAFQIPSNTELGSHQIVITGLDPNGSPVTIILPLNVTRIPATGKNTTDQLPWALGLILFGSFAVLIVRRRIFSFRY